MVNTFTKDKGLKLDGTANRESSTIGRTWTLNLWCSLPKPQDLCFTQILGTVFRNIVSRFPALGVPAARGPGRTRAGCQREREFGVGEAVVSGQASQPGDSSKQTMTRSTRHCDLGSGDSSFCECTFSFGGQNLVLLWTSNLC